VTRRIVPALLLSLALVACAPDVEGPSAALDQAEALPLKLAYQGLCDARAIAESGDMWGASDIFQSRSHAYLHEVAAKVQAVDREVAARLLQAKQAVEAQLATPDTANPQLVVASLSTLETALGDSAESLELTRPVCGGAPS
jgi:hypothetical protein